MTATGSVGYPDGHNWNLRWLQLTKSLERLREVYLIGDIEKDTARATIERLRELASDNSKPITLYINSAGGNVTDGLALHDTIRHIVSRGIEVTIIVQGMAYSMGSIVLYSFAIGHPMSLIFHPFEITAIALSVFATSMVVGDGESNWVEGLQLISVYVIIAMAFYFIP